jgi:hypothetical protein
MALAKAALDWDEDRGEITLRVSRKRLVWRSLWLTCGSLAALGLALGLSFSIGEAKSSSQSTKAFAWIVAGGLAGLAFGVNAIEAVRRLLIGNSDFKLNHDGILDPCIGHVIPWTAIKGILALPDMETGRIAQFSLWVANPDRYSRDIGWWQKIFGGFVRTPGAGAIPLPSVNAGMLPISTAYLLFLVVNMIRADPALRSHFPDAESWLPPAFDPWEEEVLLLPEARLAGRLVRQMGERAAAFADARVRAAREAVDDIRARRWTRVRDILLSQAPARASAEA